MTCGRATASAAPAAPPLPIPGGPLNIPGAEVDLQSARVERFTDKDGTTKVIEQTEGHELLAEKAKAAVILVRMQPDDIALPIDHHSGVPCRR